MCRWSAGWLVVAPLWLACHGAPEPVVEPTWLPDGGAVVRQAPVARFSGSRVVETTRRLASRGAETTTSEALARRRLAIQEDLAAFGVPSEEWLLASASAVSGPAGDIPPATSVHAVVGVLDGESNDVILLLAGGDAPDREGFVRSPVDRASGTAVLLELARVLAARPRPYTVWLGFQDDSRSEADLAFESSELFADELARRGARDRVRVVVSFTSLFDPELQIERDLGSHRVHRETFWVSARALGLEDVFPADAPFSSPETAHVVWSIRGYRAVVAIVGGDSSDTLDSRSESSLARTSEQTNAAIATRLDEFGVVVLDALDRIVSRFASIDEFSKSPLTSERWEEVPLPRDAPSVPAPVP